LRRVMAIFGVEREINGKRSSDALV
jgi:hypothetical protein